MEDDKKGEKTRREKLLELQELDAKIKQIEDGLLRIEEQIIEISTVVDSIKDLEAVKEDSTILVPVSNGIFVKAKIVDPKNLKVNIGAGTVVEKTSVETRDMLLSQLNAIEGYKDELFSELQSLVKYASTLQTDMIMGDRE